MQLIKIIFSWVLVVMLGLTGFCGPAFADVERFCVTGDVEGTNLEGYFETTDFQEESGTWDIQLGDVNFSSDTSRGKVTGATAHFLLKKDSEWDLKIETSGNDTFGDYWNALTQEKVVVDYYDVPTREYRRGEADMVPAYDPSLPCEEWFY